MKITPRLTLLILGLSLVPMGLLSLHYYWTGKAALRKEVLDHLSFTALHLEERVDEKFRQRLSKFALILSGRSMARSLAAYLEGGHVGQANQVCGVLSRVEGIAPDIRGFAFMDTTGRIALVHDSSEAPPRAILEEMFLKDWRKGVVHVWAPDSVGLSLFLGGPVLEQGRLAGLAVARAKGLDLRRLVGVKVASKWDLNLQLISLTGGKELAYVQPGAPMRREPLDGRDALHDPAVAAWIFSNRKDTVFANLVDSRGTPVLAAVRVLESADWSLVVQVDQELAFAPLRRFRDRTLFALVAVSLAAILASFLASRRLTRPLLELVSLAREFSAGHLGHRAKADALDELGELGRSLNAMAENLVSREELQAYIDQMSTLSVKLDLEGRVLTANRAFLETTGRRDCQVIGRHYLEGAWLHEGRQAEERMRRALREAGAGTVVHREEALLVQGKVRMVHFTLNPVRDEKGRVAYVISEGRDITALKDAQEALYEVNEGLEESVRERTRSLQGALREKDMLLREIHHRVKNNLQIISSLLSLQSVHVQDPQVAGVLMESRNRVKSMALVHERLYAGDDLGRVGFSGYIRDLAAQLVRSSEAQTRDVGLHFELDDIAVGLTQAIPCGLAVHELVANSLKHAFPDGRSALGHHAKVIIRCRSLPEGGFELEVEDNGVGLPEGFDPRKSRTLGLQLVFTLVKQLRGVIEVDRVAGTRVRIAIPGMDEKEVEHAV